MPIDHSDPRHRGRPTSPGRPLDRRLATRGRRLLGDPRARPIARRNLIFSVLSEHIGFSVWSLWSVLVLFLGPDYGIDPAEKFLLTALPTLVGARAAAAVHLRGRQVRRPQLDDRQRAAAAGPDDPDRDRARARRLVHTLLIVVAVRRRRRRQLRLVDDQHQRLLPGPAQGLGARDQRRRRQPRRAGRAAGRPARAGHARRAATRGRWWRSTSR